jgi:hypothetical protein
MGLLDGNETEHDGNEQGQDHRKPGWHINPPRQYKIKHSWDTTKFENPGGETPANPGRQSCMLSGSYNSHSL